MLVAEIFNRCIFCKIFGYILHSQQANGAQTPHVLFYQDQIHGQNVTEAVIQHLFRGHILEVVYRNHGICFGLRVHHAQSNQQTEQPNRQRVHAGIQC